LEDQDKLAECHAYTVPHAGSMVGLKRNASYDAAKRGDIPTMRFGKTLRVPKKLWDSIIEGAPQAKTAGSAS